MKTISTKFIISTAITLLLMAGFMTQASAYCYTTGKVVRAVANTIGSNNISYFYIAPVTSGIPTFHYYIRALSNDGRSAALLGGASNSGQTVHVRGSATSCPTTGSYRFMGNVDYVHKYTTR